MSPLTRTFGHLPSDKASSSGRPFISLLTICMLTLIPNPQQFRVTVKILVGSSELTRTADTSHSGLISGGTTANSYLHRSFIRVYWIENPLFSFHNEHGYHISGLIVLKSKFQCPEFDTPDTICNPSLHLTNGGSTWFKDGFSIRPLSTFLHLKISLFF